MIKKLSTILLAACMAAPSMAQTYSSNDEDGVLYAPQKGQWQVSMFLGGGNKFYNENTGYLLPRHSNIAGNGDEVGLPNGGSIDSGNLNGYLNIDGLNGNSLTNIIGFEGKYFLSDCWDINLQFSMDINLTPKKDYVEGDRTIGDMAIPAQKYINAQMTNNWYVSFGSNRYFQTANARIHPYLGAAVGFHGVAAHDGSSLAVAEKGIVHLSDRKELPVFESASEQSLWLVTQQIAHAMQEKGVEGCAQIVSRLRRIAPDRVKTLAYRLYSLADQKGWTQEAYIYNALVVSWNDIQTKAMTMETTEMRAGSLIDFGG